MLSLFRVTSGEGLWSGLCALIHPLINALSWRLTLFFEYVNEYEYECVCECECPSTRRTRPMRRYIPYIWYEDMEPLAKSLCWQWEMSAGRECADNEWMKMWINKHSLILSVNPILKAKTGTTQHAKVIPFKPNNKTWYDEIEYNN